MRFAPVTAALSLALAMTASMGLGAQYDADPRAQNLVMEGRAALEMGQPQRAIDAFEAALAVDPGYTEVFLELAAAARREGLQGKAIRYYREALARDPGNLAAISGEGAALIEKGALEKARDNLAKLESLCGSGCRETTQLARMIERGPQPSLIAAETVMPDSTVSQN